MANTQGITAALGDRYVIEREIGMGGMAVVYLAERGHLIPLADGTAFLQIAETAELLTYFKLSGPGHVARLGASARPTRAVTVSEDLKRATVYQRDYRADAWISKVIRQ